MIINRQRRNKNDEKLREKTLTAKDKKIINCGC